MSCVDVVNLENVSVEQSDNPQVTCLFLSQRLCTQTSQPRQQGRAKLNAPPWKANTTMARAAPLNQKRNTPPRRARPSTPQKQVNNSVPHNTNRTTLDARDRYHTEQLKTEKRNGTTKKKNESFKWVVRNVQNSQYGGGGANRVLFKGDSSLDA